MPHMSRRTVLYVRKQLGMAPQDLDELLGLPTGTIASVEDGKAELSQGAVIRLRSIIEKAAQAGAIANRRNLGMLVRQARVAMGMTQQQVADRSGIERSVYARIEQQPYPRFQTLQRIAEGMGIPLAWILGGTTPLAKEFDDQEKPADNP